MEHIKVGRIYRSRKKDTRTVRVTSIFKGTTEIPGVAFEISDPEDRAYSGHNEWKVSSALSLDVFQELYFDDETIKENVAKDHRAALLMVANARSRVVEHLGYPMGDSELVDALIRVVHHESALRIRLAEVENDDRRTPDELIDPRLTADEIRELS